MADQREETIFAHRARRYAEEKLKAMGKVVTVVKTAQIGDIGNRLLRGNQQIHRMTQTHVSNVVIWRQGGNRLDFTFQHAFLNIKFLCQIIDA